MLQNYSRYRVLQVFFDHPRKRFYMRELSRTVGLTHPALLNHLRAMVADSLLLRSEEGLYPTYAANLDNGMFRMLKEQDLVVRLYTSGLVTHIEERCRPDCIVLFGSASRGEDTENSDVDLFVQAGEAELELGPYEKDLKRRIHLLFEPEVGRLGAELLNNLANGRVISGYLRVAV